MVETMKRMLGELGALVKNRLNDILYKTRKGQLVVKVASKYSWKVSPNFSRSIQEVATKYPRLVFDMS